MKQGFPGEDLRCRREELGYTVQDVYRKVRIPRHVVDALERGDTAHLPASCYTLGFIRSYCAFIELDPDRYMDSYRASVRPVSWFRLGRQSIDIDTEGTPVWVQTSLSWGAVLAVFALLWFTYASVFQPPADRTETQRMDAAMEEPVQAPTPPQAQH
jgi:cytoskeleton protein RodZ